ncbi:MAG: PDZ domain-containing protein [Planctomycetota bacterium]|jgi:hypothetical protein
MWAGTLIGSVALVVADASAMVAVEQAEVQRWFERTGAIVLRGRIAGEPVIGVVNTAMPHGTLHSVRAAGLQLGQSVKTARGSTNALRAEQPVYSGVEVQLAGTTYAQQRLVILDHSPLFRPLSLEFDAFFGMDVLQDRVLVLQCSQGRVMLLEERPPEVRGVPLRLRSVSAGFGGPMPHVRVNVPEVGWQTFKLSTGTNVGLSLNRDLCHRLERAGQAVQIPPVQRQTAGYAGQPRLYVLRQFELAGRVFENIVVPELAENAIGLGLLRQFDGVFDFSAEMAWLQSIEADSLELLPDASGVSLVQDDSARLLVRDLQVDGPAVRAGLRMHDELLAVDGQPVSVLSARRIRDRFRQGGDILLLRVRRGDELLQTRLLLKWHFEYPPQWPVRPEVAKAPLLPELD